MTGLNVILGFQSGHLIQDEWAQLQKRIERKDKNCTDSLIISAGAPNRAGQCFLSEELLADALLRHPEPVATTNLSSVILHFWSAGRAVELRGEQPVELWPAVCSGFSRRPCHFEHSRSVARTERNTPRRVAGLGEGARHLLDLPRGYHTAHRAQAWERRRRSAASLRPVCGAVGAPLSRRWPSARIRGGAIPEPRHFERCRCDIERVGDGCRVVIFDRELSSRVTVGERRPGQNGALRKVSTCFIWPGNAPRRWLTAWGRVSAVTAISPKRIWCETSWTSLTRS
jgi:hypothetical protein